jgi:hypothetical protein
VLLADAGYWHHEQMQRIVDQGIQVLIPPDAKRREGTRPGWDGGLYAFMRRVLATDHGAELYGQRQAIIEPVFATRSSTAASTVSDAEAEPPSPLSAPVNDALPRTYATASQTGTRASGPLMRETPGTASVCDRLGGSRSFCLGG